MPGHLSAIRFERDIAHGKISGLNRARATDQILRTPSSGIGPARDLREVCDDHDLDKSSRLVKVMRGCNSRCRHDARADIGGLNRRDASLVLQNSIHY